VPTTFLPRRAASSTLPGGLTRPTRRILTLDNIERRSRLTPEVLDHEHLRRGRPVIITDLWKGTSAEALCDPRRAVAALGHMPLPVGPNLIEEFLSGRERLESRWVSMADFHGELLAGCRDMVLEHDVPEELESILPVSPYLDLGDPDDFWVSQMFMAGPGSYLHLHFDMDLRHVVMHQVFGRKRYVLVDAAQTRKLGAGAVSSVPYTSAMYLQNFSPEDLVDFLRYVDAWDCVLQPGEALVIPATTWHYVEYVDVAMSLNVRLARNHHLRYLAEAVPNTSVELQALAHRLRDEDDVDIRARTAFASLVAAATRRYADDDARGAALDQLVADLAGGMGLDIAAPPYQVADVVRRQLLVDQTAAAAPAPALPRRRVSRQATGPRRRR
jgi:cupin-like protein